MNEELKQMVFDAVSKKYKGTHVANVIVDWGDSFMVFTRYSTGSPVEHCPDIVSKKDGSIASKLLDPEDYEKLMTAKVLYSEE